jgi:DNA-binding NarL/FixJ family response regulator
MADVNGGDGGPRVLLTLAIIFAMIMTGAAVDLIMDNPEAWLSVHVVFELSLFVVSLGAALYLGRGWYRSTRSVGRLELQLEERKAERDQWKRNAERLLEDLSAAIGAQFDAWSLTDAERETALMVLRGYSHKRIAKLTSRSERTVRQHAVAVYRKSGLAGRAELAAFFMEGLPVPRPTSTTVSPR